MEDPTDPMARQEEPSALAVLEVDAVASGEAPASLPEGSEPEATLAPEVLEAVPRGPEVSSEELAQEVARSHVVVVRLGGIPVDALLAVGLALLIDAAFVGVLLAVIWLGPAWLRVPDRTGDGLARTTLSIETDDGGSGTGGMPKGTAPNIGEEPQIAGETASAFRAARAELERMPPMPLPEGQVPGPSVEATPEDPARGLIALSTPREWPTGPRVKPPVRTAVPPTTVPAKPAADTGGPSVADVNGPTERLVASAGGNGSKAVAQTLGPGDGGGDEEIVDIMKPGKGGGVGKGSGRGRGNGIDRGPSGANINEPQILDFHDPFQNGKFPLQYALRGGKLNNVTFQVTVSAEGKVDELKLVSSSGDKAIDALVRQAYAKAKYRPAYRAGRPVTGTMEVGYNFTAE